MLTRSSSTGFTVVARERAPDHGMFPVLIATVSLVLSIAVVLTAMSMSAARATQLF
jgi:hypothetical protein